MRRDHAQFVKMELRYSIPTCHGMAVYRLINNSGLQANRIALVNAVFEDLCRTLGLSSRDDRLRDIVAEAVIRCAEQDIIEPEEVRKCAEVALREAYPKPQQ